MSWVYARHWMTGVIITTLLLAVFPVAQTWLIREVINNISNYADNVIGLLPMVGLIAAVTLADTVGTQVQRYFVGNLSVTMRAEIDNLVIEKATRLDQAFLEDPEYQNVVDRAMQHVGLHIAVFLENALKAITQILRLAGLSLLIVFINPLIIIAAVPVLAIYVLFRWYFAKKNYNKVYERAGRNRWYRHFASLVLDHHSAQEIRVFGIGRALVQRFADINDDFLQEDKRLIRQEMIFGLLLEVLLSIVLYGAALFAVLQAFLKATPLGDLFAYGRTVLQIQIVIQSASHAAGVSLEHGLYMSDVRSLMAYEPISQEGTIAHLAQADKVPVIEFRDVTFTYPGTDIPALQQVSLHIKPAECVAIVGMNGSGKSTLLKLLLHQYDLQEGSIHLDDYPIEALTRHSLYSHFTYVAQAYNRYEARFLDNIAFQHNGANTLDVDTLERSIRLAELDELYQRLPQKEHTVLGRLFGQYEPSMGQWQRLAIARMIARPAPIIVLDEPTSSLDAVNEDMLLTNIINAYPERTKIFVSHRFTTIQKAERIIVMREGRIVQDGAHEELYQQEGEYQLLYQSAYRGTLTSR